MSRKIYGNDLFQFGLIVFVALGLSLGVVLTNGKATLNSLLDAQVQINYCREAGRECAPGGTNDCCPGFECKFREANYTCESIPTLQCTNNKLFQNSSGKLTLIEDCSLTGKTCSTGSVGTSAGCYTKAELTYTNCSGGNVYTCVIGSKCKLKYICQNGCTPSDYQVDGVMGGLKADCISSTIPSRRCVVTIIYGCDGTYCKNYIRNCYPGTCYEDRGSEGNIINVGCVKG